MYSINKESDTQYIVYGPNNIQYKAFILKTDPLKIVLYDYQDHEELSKFKWCLNNGYAYSSKSLMHRMIAIDIMKLPGYDNTKLSVDHINEHRLDNRRENLRIVSQSVQNSNRGTRSDKKPPHPELNSLGIEELPRYVRWDNSEKKFIIEKHPVLIKEKEQGIRKKAAISGTKSTRYSITEKYQDILAKLHELDEKNDVPHHTDLNLKKRLYDEYNEIIKIIANEIGYKSPVVETPKQSSSVLPERKVQKGRRNPIQLPDGCGVTIDMIPDKVSYSHATTKIGDGFRTLCGHPLYPFVTSRSKEITTIEKLQQIISKMNLNQ